MVYKEHKLLNFSDTILLQKAVFMHNYRHDRLPDSFFNMFSYKVDTNQNRLHHEDGTFNTKTVKFLSPLQSAIYTWNSISRSTRELTKTSLFKKELKERLVANYEDFCLKNKCYVCNKIWQLITLWLTWLDGYAPTLTLSFPILFILFSVPAASSTIFHPPPSSSLVLPFHL